MVTHTQQSGVEGDQHPRVMRVVKHHWRAVLTSSPESPETAAQEGPSGPLGGRESCTTCHMGIQGCRPVKSRHLETYPDTVCIASTHLLLDCVFRMAL